MTGKDTKMGNSVVFYISALLLLQIVAAQGPKTAWQAGGAGMGLGSSGTPVHPQLVLSNLMRQADKALATSVNAAPSAAAATTPTTIVTEASSIVPVLSTTVPQFRPMPPSEIANHISLLAPPEIFPFKTSASLMTSSSTPPVSTQARLTEKIITTSGLTSAADFQEHQLQFAMVQINAATTEGQALNAAAAVFNPTMDMSDAVQQVLENKIRQLRTPADWPHPIPPPLPHNFDVMPLVMAAYYGTPTSAPPNAAALAAAMPQQHTPYPHTPYPHMPNPGPPTAIRRGMRTETTLAASGSHDALIQSLVNNQSPRTRDALLRALLAAPNSATSGGGNNPTGPVQANPNPWLNPQTAGNTQLTGVRGNAFGQPSNPGNAQHSAPPQYVTTPPNHVMSQTADPFFSSNPSWWF